MGGKPIHRCTKMVFSKVLFAAVLGLSAAEEAALNATANSTENETDWTPRALTEEDVTEFIKSADKDKNDKVNLEEINKLFQFDIDDEQFKKEFQGIEADAVKDGHLTKDEIFNSAGLKSFLQTAVNDEY